MARGAAHRVRGRRGGGQEHAASPRSPSGLARAEHRTSSPCASPAAPSSATRSGAFCSIRRRTSCRAPRRCCSWRRARSWWSARSGPRSSAGDRARRPILPVDVRVSGRRPGAAGGRAARGERDGDGGLVPDLTLLLTLSASRTGLARAGARDGGHDRMERAELGVSRACARRVRDVRHGRTWQAAHPECGPIVLDRRDGERARRVRRVVLAAARALARNFPFASTAECTHRSMHAITRPCSPAVVLEQCAGLGRMARRARTARRADARRRRRARMFDEVYRHIARDLRRHARRLDAVSRAPSTGWSSELHDPHSAYLSPQLLARLSERTTRPIRGRRRADRRARRMDHDRRADARRAGARGGHSDRRPHRRGRRQADARRARSRRRRKRCAARRARSVRVTVERPRRRDAAQVRAHAARDPRAIRCSTRRCVARRRRLCRARRSSARSRSRDLRRAIDSLRAAGMTSLDLRSARRSRAGCWIRASAWPICFSMRGSGS